MEDKVRFKDYVRYLIFLLIELFTILWIVKRKKIQFALIRHDLLTIQLPLCLRFLKLKTIADGELMSEVLKNKTNSMFYNFVKRYEKKIVCSYNFFKVSSVDHSENLQKVGFPKSKILIIPIGVNLENIPKFSIEEIPKHTFGYFGSLEEWQGLDILLDGFKSLQKKIPEAKLYILGDGSFKDKLEKKVALNNLKSNVVFDSVTRKVLFEEYFKKFRVTVIPRPAQKDAKDLIVPIKLVESFAAAKPTIVFDIPIMRKLPKNSVYLAKSNDAEDLANAMREVTLNEKKMNELSDNGYEVSKNYDVRKIVKKLIDSLINIKND